MHLHRGTEPVWPTQSLQNLSSDVFREVGKGKLIDQVKAILLRLTDNYIEITEVCLMTYTNFKS